MLRNLKYSTIGGVLYNCNTNFGEIWNNFEVVIQL